MIDWTGQRVLITGAASGIGRALAVLLAARWPADMGIILPERAAEICLQGLDLGLFHIPTHAHLHDDMGGRYHSVGEATAQLQLAKQA